MSSLVAEGIKRVCYKLIRADNSCLTQSSKRHASPWRGLWETGSLPIAEVGPEVTIVLVLLLSDPLLRRKKFLLLSFLSVSIVTLSCTHSKRHAAKTYQENSRLCHTSYIRAFTSRVAFLSPSFYNILVVLHVDLEQFWLLFMYIAYVKLDSLCLWKSMSTTFYIVFVLSFFSSFYILVASPLLIWKSTKSHVWKQKTGEKKNSLGFEIWSNTKMETFCFPHYFQSHCNIFLSSSQTSP